MKPDTWPEPFSAGSKITLESFWTSAASDFGLICRLAERDGHRLHLPAQTQIFISAREEENTMAVFRDCLPPRSAALFFFALNALSICLYSHKNQSLRWGPLALYLYPHRPSSVQAQGLSKHGESTRSSRRADRETGKLQRISTRRWPRLFRGHSPL